MKLNMVAVVFCCLIWVEIVSFRLAVREEGGINARLRAELRTAIQS